MGVDASAGVGHELIHGVDAQGQRTGALVQIKGRNDCVGCGLGGDGALIAIAEGIAERDAAGIEAHIIDSPTVDGDGGDVFRSCECGFAEAVFKTGENCAKGPVKGSAAMDRAVGNAMDQFDGGSVVAPAEQGDAAAFCA